MARNLPEGVYEKDGRIYRDVPRLARVVTRPDGSSEQIHDLIPVLVILSSETDPEMVNATRERAVRASDRGTRTDFLHPTLGWLIEGRKREVDPPQNLGSGSVSYQQRTTVVPRPDTGDELLAAPAGRKGA